ncbi:bicyclomycin resistance protein [Aspergillus eucalypticola CBS 122712]|uniref:Bicyclomycin resistance protein n=1 Tax=Aspergillus eucalypticola (strain CBS 122712 / IBT 29274) TaxID=1448314 RepID=A0A317VHC8_ASPEC|nr:bicyclomycin resistance protein [Aspergillus eucalypticola CBS 122712]PWY72577.1 bicyclomycin resistance protein [Aspergillus eucalypticola CBS 122712]
MVADSSIHPADVKELGHQSYIPFWQLLIDQQIITKEVLNHRYDGSGTEDDPYVVNWLSIDPRNPMQFSMARKAAATFATAVATFVISLTSSAYSGSMQEIVDEFNVGKEVATLGLSLFVFGFAVGPLVWAPLSETIGRQIPFFASFLILAAFSAGCAGAHNIQTLLILRFFGGAFGSAPLTNAGGVISDMFAARERGLAMLLFASTPYLGPALGPIIGGFLGMNAGWRWVEGFLAACTGMAWILMAFLVPETYAPVLLRKRAAKLSLLTGNCYESKLDLERGKTSIVKRLKIAFSRPWVLLFTEPIVLLLTFYAALIYGILYMLFEALPIVYQDIRGWNAGVGGLPFLGVMIGVLCGSAYTVLDNKRYIKAQEKHNGVAPPESRLPPSMVSAVTIPIGLFWFAWTNSPSIYWLCSVAALVPFGFGLLLIYMGIVNYLIDSYTIYSASVLAGMSVFRYAFGAIFPLFSSYMYEGLGIHWASCIPAFLSVLCMPLPFLFYKFGVQIRQRCKYAALSQKRLETLRQASLSEKGPVQPIDQGAEKHQQVLSA